MQFKLSKSDPNFYKSLLLENGLKVVLISSQNPFDASDSDSEVGDRVAGSADPDQEPEVGGIISAAALSVNCGFFQDPPYMYGLAHFVEHALFMGSKKYPQENAFSDLISRHHGSQNAVTEGETTTFNFEVDQRALAKALDIFANFFVEPLFNKDSLERELQAVDNEFHSKQMLFGFVASQVLRAQAGDHTPMSNFYLGNRRSLQDLPRSYNANMRQEVVDFFHHYYSADVMTLCVQSSFTLEKMEEIVRQTFSQVPRRERFRIEYPSEPPFPDRQRFEQFCRISSLTRNSTVLFQWIVPIDDGLEYKHQSFRYICHVVGHKGDNGIFDNLRRRLWATDLEAGCLEGDFYNNRMCRIFGIKIILTEAGSQNLVNVAKYVFQYLRFFKRLGVFFWQWNELRRLHKLRFDYDEEVYSLKKVIEISMNMQRYPERYYICGDSLFSDYSPSKIMHILSFLGPTRCNVIHTDYKYQDESHTYKVRDPWTNAKYEIGPFPDGWYETCVTDRLFQRQLLLPQPTIFEPSDMAIKEDPEFVFQKVPVVLHEEKGIKLWYLKDSCFLVPKVCIGLDMLADWPSGRVTKRLLSLEIVSIIFQHSRQALLWQAAMGGLEVVITPMLSGISMTFAGFNHRLPRLFEIIMGEFHRFTFGRDDFLMIKNELRNSYYNALMAGSNPLWDLQKATVFDDYVMLAEKVRELNNINQREVEEHISQFRQQLFVKLYVCGNANSHEAQWLLKHLRCMLNSKPTFKPKNPRHAILNGEICLRFLSMNVDDRFSRILNYYHIGPVHFNEIILMQLLSAVMKEKTFHELRTKKQLGYEVICCPTSYANCAGVSIIVEFPASLYSLSYVDKQIDDLVENMTRVVYKLRKDDFKALTEVLIKTRAGCDYTLASMYQETWEKTHYEHTNFKDDEYRAEFLRKIELKQFQHWCRKFLRRKQGRNKYSLQSVGYGKASLEECIGGDEIIKMLSKGTKMPQTDINETPRLQVMLPIKKKKTYVTDLYEFFRNRRFHDRTKQDPTEPFKI